VIFWLLGSAVVAAIFAEENPHSSPRESFGSLQSPCRRWVEKMREDWSDAPGWDADELENIYADSDDSDVQVECQVALDYLKQGFHPDEVASLMQDRLETDLSQHKRTPGSSRAGRAVKAVAFTAASLAPLAMSLPSLKSSSAGPVATSVRARAPAARTLR
jgi:hypothetical protein